MKVVYNSCYGGFGLSEEGLLMLAELKGYDLTTCEVKYSGIYKDDRRVFDSESCDRNDPDLVKVVETLGEDANGGYADLSIEEIPDGAEYEITEYDGYEYVVPPRQEW